MSYAFNDFIACSNQQEYLASAFKGLDPGTIGKKTGYLDFLVSSLNEDGSFQRTLNPGSGRRRVVELVYQPRIGENDVEDGARYDCTPGQERGETSELYTIDPDTEGSKITWSGKQVDLEVRCEADEFYWARQLAYNMSALRRKIATEAVVQSAAQFGLFEDDTIIKDVKTKSGDAWLSDGIEEVEFQFDLMQSDRPVWTFAMGDWSKYITATMAGCCATTNVDLGAYAVQNNLNFMKDDSVRTELGEDQIIATIPGAVQMLRYLEYEGNTRELDQATYKQYTVVDPVNGLTYDFNAEFKCGTWQFCLKLAYKFVTMPNDMFFTDDVLSGVKWLNNFQVVNV